MSPTTDNYCRRDGDTGAVGVAVGLAQYYDDDEYTGKCAPVVVPIAGVTADAAVILVSYDADVVVRCVAAYDVDDDGGRCYCWDDDCN